MASASPTLRDVAARAGVSIKTASRVVNGESGVAPATSRRVDEARMALGYVPNVAARRLVRRRAFVLGVVYQNNSWNWLNDFQSGAIEAARTAGYEILMHPCDVNDASERDLLLRSLDQGSVDGLVLTPPCGDLDALVSALELRSAPYVRIAPSLRAGPRATVSAADFEGARLVGEHLVGLGHRRVAFIAGDRAQRSSHDREAGFLAALERHGLSCAATLQGDYSFESGRRCARALLDARVRPTAVFASNDDMAAGVLSTCHEQGVLVPRDLSVAGFDDVALASQVWPRLTTVEQPTREMARRAVDLLVDRLDDVESKALHPELETRLVIRDSTGPPCS